LATRGRNIDIDELFRSKLEDYPVTPGDAVKAQLMKKVSAREFLRFNPGRFNIWYVAASVITVSIALTIALSNKQPENPAGNLSAEDTVIVNEITPQVMPDTTISIKEGETESIERKTPDTSGKIGAGTLTERNQTEERIVQPKISKQTQPVGYTFVVSGLNDKSRPIGAPVSSFTVSALSGCAPMKVTLKNTSPYTDIKWLSSDGRVSDKDSVGWVFGTPGSYKILLTVTDADGREGHSSTEITVNQLPVATFDVSAVSTAGREKDMITYNYSEGAVTYLWDFGDGKFSDLREPAHTYRNSGNYRVLLTVVNEAGCRDTVSHIFTVRSTNRIEFPNAFIPNQDGPTGGYYSSRSDDAAHVFHPEYEGVVEYSLTIYNRAGMVVFESRDLNIGWDGYYKGKLSDPGVYIFRSRGRFSNGEQFSKSGDLTLLKYKMQ
jgi:PKD repeat protein